MIEWGKKEIYNLFRNAYLISVLEKMLYLQLMNGFQLFPFTLLNCMDLHQKTFYSIIYNRISISAKKFN